MSRRDGTFRIRQDKPVKNCGSTVITPKTKGDVAVAKPIRNVHTIETPRPLFPKIINYTIPTENITEPLTSVEGKRWVPNGPYTKPVDFPEVVVKEMTELINGSELPFEASPSVADIDKVYNEQLTPEQEEAIIEQRRNDNYTKDIKLTKQTFERQLEKDREEAEKANLLLEKQNYEASPLILSTPERQEEDKQVVDVSPKPTRGRKKKEDLSNTTESLFPANNETIKE